MSATKTNQLYGRTLVKALRIKAAQIKGVEEISFNDTAEVIAKKTGKACSGSNLAWLHRSNDAPSKAKAKQFATFLGIPVDTIEILPPLDFEKDNKRKPANQTKKHDGIYGVADFHRIISHAC